MCITKSDSLGNLTRVINGNTSLIHSLKHPVQARCDPEWDNDSFQCFPWSGASSGAYKAVQVSLM